MKYRIITILTEGPEAMYTQNFWKLFPELKEMDVFKDIYKDDKATTKKKSSTIMWGIVLVVHPESMFYNMPDKKEEIKKEFIKDDKFSWTKYEDALDKFKDICMTQAERSMVVWEDTMKMRDRSLKAMYKDILDQKDVKLIAEMDKLLANNSKFFKEFEQTKMEIVKEDSKRKTGKKESLSDMGEI